MSSQIPSPKEKKLLKEIFDVVARNTGDVSVFVPEKSGGGFMVEPDSRARIEACIYQPYWVPRWTKEAHMKTDKNTFVARDENLVSVFQKLAAKVSRLIKANEKSGIETQYDLQKIKKSLSGFDSSEWNNEKDLYYTFRYAVIDNFQPGFTPRMNFDDVTKPKKTPVSKNPFAA